MQKAISAKTSYRIKDVYPEKRFSETEQRRVASQISATLTKTAKEVENRSEK